MTKKEVLKLLGFGNSHQIPIEGFPLGVTRWQVFLALSPILEGRLYWQALGIAYIASDNLYHYRHDVRFAFLKCEPEREQLMTKQERDYLAALPDQITIYRGMTREELSQKSFGISWTLKREQAEFFANEYPRNYATNHLERVVHELIINKSEVIAFFNGAAEFEIIYISDKKIGPHL